MIESFVEHVNQAWVDSNLGSQPFGVYTDKVLLNQPTIFARQPLEVLTRPQEFIKYMDWFKKTPECVSLISVMITDILADGYYFEGAESARKKAEKFATENNLFAQLEGGLYDFLILGNGFWYCGDLTQDKIKEIRDAYVTSRKIRNYEFVTTMLSKFDKNDESAGMKLFQYVPATTMNVTPSDRFASSLIYTQRVGAFVSAFAEDEIIHLKDLNLNGEIWGMSRFKSIIAEVTLLGILKDYYGHELDNYGVPPGMFAFPDEQPDSQNINNINRLLIQGQRPENKNRVWVLAGNAQYTAFERLKDMEFKNLADFLIRIIAMVWQVPPSRWGGSDAKGGRDTPLSNEGYYRNIAHLQSKLESVMNSQLWAKDFNVKIRFRKTHQEDEVRVAQAEKIKTDLAQQRMQLGLWSKESALEFLHIPEEKAGEIDPTKLLMAPDQGSQYNQVDAGNETHGSAAKADAQKTKAPRNRSASSDVRANSKDKG